MKVLILHELDGQERFVNMEHAHYWGDVSKLYANNNTEHVNQTRIWFGGNSYLIVLEKASYINVQLREAALDGS